MVPGAPGAYEWWSSVNGLATRSLVWSSKSVGGARDELSRQWVRAKTRISKSTKLVLYSVAGYLAIFGVILFRHFALHK